MESDDWLAQRFEEHRARLRTMAMRMLDSPSEADDAVQESWLRLSRAGPAGIDNLGGWLTTVVSRVCLDMLRSRASRREQPGGPQADRVIAGAPGGGDPEHDVLLADALGPALQVVLDSLAPAERLAFVLHDVFAVPFAEIATILGRSPNAAKQLATRARRRLQGSTPEEQTDAPRQRAVVDAFLAASRSGDLDGLVAVLHPDIVFRADPAAVRMGSRREVRGAAAVAQVFSGRAAAARPALVDGIVAVTWAPGGRPRVVWDITVAGDAITRIDMIADPDSLGELDLVLLG
ncbi:MAG: sigma-70 family RNA polymerase sigma factor [Actinomycetota bacterium]|nr:sigma-70 family RNA polymerase sigma factor [Actinomycetota bacterium]